MRRIKIFLVAGLVLSLNLAAFQDAPIDYASVYQIKDEGFNNSQVMDIDLDVETSAVYGRQ